MYTKKNKTPEIDQPAGIQSCPTKKALDLLDGKWKLAILNSLMHESVMRFGELKRSIPDITARMLTAQLRELEARGIVHRKVYPIVPPKVEYRLTDLGMTLRPVLEALRDWSFAHSHELSNNSD